MLIRSLLTQLAVPPALNIVLLLLGLLLMRRYRRLGLGLAAFSLTVLVLLSLPWVKMLIFQGIEIHPPLDIARLSSLDPTRSAMVVLGGGMRGPAREYGRYNLSDNSMRRILFAGELATRATDTGHPLPVLVSGGGPPGAPDTEASLMALILDRMGHPVRWQENRSRTTWENATLSAPLLRQAGIDTVVLVTDAWHMQRAVKCFQAQGLTVIPAPTAFRGSAYPDIRAFVPDREALADSGDAIREWLGLLTYDLFYAGFAAPESASGKTAAPANAAPDPSPVPSRSAPAGNTDPAPATSPSA